MKRVRKFLRELFCRHDMGLAAEWYPDDPEEICIHAVCPKCGKLYGHFHIPTLLKKSGKTHVRFH